MNSQFEISKEFSFCYGHRVWSQELNGDYANDLKCACRHLHGHEAKVVVTLGSNVLEKGMVTDFRHLEWLKKWLDTHVDHHFIIDINDPLYSILTMGVTPKTLVVITPPRSSWNTVIDNGFTAARRFDISGEPSQAEAELLEGMLVVDFVPTSENLAAWLHKIVSTYMKPLNVEVTRVDWYETPKSKSSYTNRWVA